ncbi:hypothetical protein AZE42_12671 [Rhizopogon vesiculosus]|uniref:ABC transporter domain-containing protein n=1 Tax=Rhizopogon vesiculosus TaxID=180088 RepID=A0A1J8PLI5_9AGAM|nr:hypothetical protein AZE42_12671 [Rhizopogon vesiculosus]
MSDSDLHLIGLSDEYAQPLLARERTFTANAATVMERAVSAIATVKAFNAAIHETRVLSGVLGHGKVAAAGLAGMISGAQQTSSKRRRQELRKLQPKPFNGELSLMDMSFTYPARPDFQVLRNVSMYLPAHETTYIIGSSGSRKLTLGAILMGAYTPTSGCVLLDEQDVRYIDTAYMSHHITGVAQGAASAPVFPGSLHENVALATVGRGRHSKDVSRGEVEEACRVAMLESWILGLDQGYDTLLSGTGAEGIQLSSGQRQRLALARAWIQDPDVLILNEATSALDPPIRSLIMAVIRRWRHNRTTIIITHDITTIEEQDFVYVMRNGSVIEQGFQSDLAQAGGEFTRMLRISGIFIGDDLHEYDAVAEILAAEDDDEHEPAEYRCTNPFAMQWPFALLRAVYPTIPAKPFAFSGLVICLLSGAMTPVFSFLLSRLIVLVSAGGSDASSINSYSGLVLGVAALDGLLLGSKFFVMETSATCWVTRLRDMAFSRILRQDKSWFDCPENGASRPTQVIVKDGDDARTLFAVVVSQIVAVGAMMTVGLIWAMAWECALHAPRN